MCWFIDKNKILPLVANEDIEVIKVVLKNGKTPFLNYIVAFNERLPKVSIVPQYGSRLAMIEAGYHSYSKKIVITEQLATFTVTSSVLTLNGFCDYQKDSCFYKAYIPKGTTYYENDNGEIVSESLIVTDDVIPLDNLNIDVIIDDNGKLKEKKFEKNSNDNIVGIKLDEFEQEVHILSMLDEDWIPMDMNTYSKRNSHFAEKYGGDSFFDVHDQKSICTYYRIREIIKGQVDWKIPFWVFCGKHLIHITCFQYEYDYQIKGKAIRICRNVINKSLIESESTSK